MSDDAIREAYTQITVEEISTYHGCDITESSSNFEGQTLAADGG